MTTTETHVPEQGDTGPPVIDRPGSSALRRSAAIRVAVAVFLAAGLSAAAIVALWTPHPSKSDVIGYPIFADFNPSNYAHAYYLAVGLFPIAALLIFLGLTWIGPRVRLAVPPSRGRLRPLVTPAEAERSPDLEPISQVNRRFAAGARVALVGAVLGLEVGVASNHLWVSVVLVTVGYLLLVALGSSVIGRFTAPQWNWAVRLATANALGSPLTVAGLSLVSAHTTVTVVSNHSVQHYPWFPVWLGVPFAAGLFAWILISLRRGGPASAAAIERRSVLLIAAPVALFVLVADLPGDLGRLGLYEQGQVVTETRLLLHGWLPWRDVVAVHGLLRDVVPTAVGWGVFGNSYWGSIAGVTVIFDPLVIVTTYFLFVYLVGRSWPMLLIGASIFLGTWFGVTDARYVLWPLVLLLLAALLKRFTRVRAIALGVLTVVQTIVSTDLLATVPVVFIVLAAYDWYWRPRGAPLARAFRRTVWFAISVVIAGGAFAIYMASRGALGDVISVTRDSLAAKFNQGIPPSPDGVAQAEFDFIALAPVAVLLVSFAYGVVRLRLRRPFLLADWLMAAVVVYLLFYYAKFLTFMDLPHAGEPFTIAMPLMIYIVYRAFTVGERWIRSRVPERRAGWLTAHPMGVALLICFLVLFWGPLHTWVETAPAKYRPIAPEPSIARVGYAAQYDAPAVEDLGRIVNAYLGPHDRLLDITNEPALFFYWLNRDPSSRWVAPISILSTAGLQRSLIDELRRAPPKLVVFDDTDNKMYGLAGLSGVSANVFLYLDSRWILDHYRPLLVSHGRTIYGLPDLPPVSSLHLHLHQRPATTGVPFLGAPCNWGDSPTFLSGPGEPSSSVQSVPVRTAVARPAQVTFIGWAGDLRVREPAREVIATFNGRIVGRTRPDSDRPDVPATGLPAGFLRSGFQLSIPASANAPAALRIFAIGRNGSVAQLGTNTRGHDKVARIDGRTVTLQPAALIGHIDAKAATAPLIEIEPPVGSTWADYRWLEVDAPSFGGFLPGGFSLSDQRDATNLEHTITFNTLGSSPRRYIVPVSSCQQWWGYGSSPLFVASTPPQEMGGVRLIR
jgi:hypothetical protein